MAETLLRLVANHNEVTPSNVLPMIRRFLISLELIILSAAMALVSCSLPMANTRLSQVAELRQRLGNHNVCKYFQCSFKVLCLLESVQVNSAKET